MPVFTVHINATNVERDKAAEQMVLIPEKINFWALCFGPIWLIWNRLWLALVAWISVLTIMITMSIIAGLPSAAILPVYYGSIFLLALEANQLRRRQLEKRGIMLVDVTSGADMEDAERRFLSRELSVTKAKVLYQQDPLAATSAASSTSDQIGGLFTAGEQP